MSAVLDIHVHSLGPLICSNIYKSSRIFENVPQDLKKAKNIRTGTWRKPGFWSLWWEFTY